MVCGENFTEHPQPTPHPNQKNTLQRGVSLRRHKLNAIMAAATIQNLAITNRQAQAINKLKQKRIKSGIKYCENQLPNVFL